MTEGTSSAVSKKKVEKKCGQEQVNNFCVTKKHLFKKGSGSGRKLSNRERQEDETKNSEWGRKGCGPGVVCHSKKEKNLTKFRLEVKSHNRVG